MDLIWLDLETTGLDPRKDSILEVAAYRANFDRPFDAELILSMPIATALTDQQLDPFILDMHTRNGLLRDCRERGWRLQSVEAALIFLVREVENKDERPILAGSTISFDHEFLKVHMPVFAARLSHRHYDVSAIKLFARSFGRPPWPKAEAHRADADILESIDHAKDATEWLVRGSYVTNADGSYAIPPIDLRRVQW